MDNDIIMRLRENLDKVQEKQASDEEMLKNLMSMVIVIGSVLAVQTVVLVCSYRSNIKRCIFFLPAFLINWVNSERTAYEPIEDEDNEREDRDNKNSTGESESATEKSDKEAKKEQYGSNSGDQEKIEKELEACEKQNSERTASEEQGATNSGADRKDNEDNMSGFEIEGIEKLSKASDKNEDDKEAARKKLEIKAKEENTLGFEETVDKKENDSECASQAADNCVGTL